MAWWDLPRRRSLALHSVETSTIEQQAKKGWVDFHPEDFCHRCGQRNVHAWWVESDLWRTIDSGVTGILCPQCFTELYQEAHPAQVLIWKLALEHVSDDRAERAEATAAQLRDALAEAQLDLANWGAYASEYFQTKWDLPGDLARIEDLLNSPAVQALPDTTEGGEP